MNYIEVNLEIHPFQPYSDILMADLAEIGFESFVEEKAVLKAYIPETDFLKTAMEEVLESISEATINYTYSLIPDQNWNAEWEKNFPAVEVGNYCRIRAPFHPSDASFEYEIIIEPKMSFGTGHHSTTFLMIQGIQGLDIKGKSVLDMGCGTGVLAILAEKEGAGHVMAIDIENWSFENTKENIERNNCSKTEAVKGGAELLEAAQFDIVFANINRNILLRDMKKYVDSMKKDAKILLCGFFESDIDTLKEKANNLGLEFLDQQKKEDWCMLKFRKV